MPLQQDVRRAIDTQVPREVRNQFLLVAKKYVDEIRESIIAEFLSHPVTEEILAGPDAQNISGTLGGIGNLFSFIGFNESDRPIDPILGILQRITGSFGGFTKGGIFVTVNLPEPKDIFEVTPMPWASGRSWAQGIETGISGLGYYLNKETPYSRAGRGIQSERQIRSGVKFTATPYISRLLSKYKKTLIVNETVIPT